MTPEEKKDLRGFGLGVGGILLLFAGIAGYSWPFFSGIWPRLATTLAAIGGPLFVLGLVLPGVLGPVRDGWMRIVAPIAWFNTRLLLGLVYYGVLTPTGLIRRLGPDALRLRNVRQESYWVAREPIEDLESYRRQA